MQLPSSVLPSSAVLRRPVPSASQRPPSPDLVLEGLVGSSSRPHVGDAVWYSLTVRNQGSADAGPFTVGLRGESTEEDRYLPGLAAGEEVTLENLGPVLPRTGGRPLLVQGVADPYEAVPDADRSNNDRWDSLWVQP